jgi:hypothetical protein
MYGEYFSDAERRHSSKWHEGKSKNRKLSTTLMECIL